jgi:Right handed beta helix region
VISSKRDVMTGQFRAGLLTACVVIMLATAATSAISGQTYYVSGNGNDAADGTSRRTAWATLARVAEHTFAAGDRLLLEGGVVHRGSIHLGPDRSADDIQIGSYGHGRAIIDAGTGSGIVIENLSAVNISDLEIRGSGQETNSGDGILITSHVDPIPANSVPYSGFVIHKVEVHGFKRFGILLHSRLGTGLRDARVTRAVSHDNGLEGITVLADEFPGTPNEDIYIGYSVAYHNHGTRGLPGHSGSGIVLGGVKRGMIEHSEVYESGDQSDAFHGGGPVGIWAWNSDQVIIQFCKSHDMGTANNADGGGFDLDGATTNSVIQYNVSWNNHGYGYQLYDFFWGPHSGNTVRYNVTIGDGKVTSSRRPTPGQGVLVGVGNLINESFHHNIAYVENEGESDVKLAQIDRWPGDGLAFHDNIYLAGNTIRPFDVIDSTGTNLKMFGNIYYLAEEPLPFHWNKRVYNTIDEWRTEIGLDGSSQFLIGPHPPRGQRIRSALGALMREPTLQPEMFHKLHALAR